MIKAAALLLAAATAACSVDSVRPEVDTGASAPAAVLEESPHAGLPAERQLQLVRQTLERYADFAVAEREGWSSFGGDEPLMGEHWYPPEELGWPDYQGERAEFDFTKPSNLMYTEIGGEKVLTGAAFVVRLREGEAVPEGFTGDRDNWHVHDFVAAIDAATEERPFLRWLAKGWLDRTYFSKGDDRGRLAMVHAWAALPNPDGPFADHNRLLGYMKHGLPVSYAEGASLDAAMGLAIAADGGCDAHLDGRLWIADAGGKTKRAVKDACEAAATDVRAAISEHGDHPHMLNAAAERAWNRFDSVWMDMLSPEERRRIAMMSEHGEGAHGDHGGHEEH